MDNFFEGYRIGDKMSLLELDVQGFIKRGKLSEKEIDFAFLTMLKPEWINQCPSFFSINKNNLQFYDGNIVVMLVPEGEAFIFSITNGDKLGMIEAIDGRLQLYEKTFEIEGSKNE